MITLNLLKKYHGLRAKYYGEREKNSTPKDRSLRYFLPAILLMVGLYGGFLYARVRVVSFFENMDIVEEETVAPPILTKIARKENIAAKAKKKSATKKKPTAPKSKRAVAKIAPPLKKKAAPPSITKKIITPSLHPKKAAPKRVVEKSKVVTGKFKLKVATFVVESNALSLRKRLTRLGYKAFINKSTIKLPTYKLSYKNIGPNSLSKIKGLLRKQGISFKTDQNSGKLSIVTESVFIRGTLQTILKQGNNLGIKGEIVKGSRKRTTGHEVISYGYKNKETLNKGLNNLKKIGFKPVIIRTGK